MILKKIFFLKSMILNEKVFVKSMILILKFVVLSDFESNFIKTRQILILKFRDAKDFK